MKLYNKLVQQLLEANTVGSVLGAPAISNKQYAAGDTRPFEPARITIGAKFKKKSKKNEPDQVMIPVFRRPRVESIVKLSK
jgi:hypothetical protein